MIVLNFLYQNNQRLNMFMRQLLLCLFICVYAGNATATLVHAPTSFFRSYNIFAQSGLANSSPKTYTVQTSIIHQNIIRCGISLFAIQKLSSIQLYFHASVTPLASTTDTFNIFINVTSPFPMGIKYFLIVIMDQSPYQIIDLHNYCINSASGLNQYIATDQVITNQIDIATQTIFPSTSGLHPIAFLTSFISTISAAVDSIAIPTHFSVSASIKNSSTMRYTFFAGSYTSVTQLCMVVVFYSNTAITFFLNQTQPLYKLDVSFSNYINASNSITYSIWGPNYDRKCILGIYEMSYYYGQQLTSELLFNSYSHYNGYKVTTPGAVITGEFLLHFFCLGQGKECADGATFYDAYTDQCLDIASCPVTPYGDYITNQLCPNCSDISCQTCNTIDRTLCISCYNYTHKQIDPNFDVCLCKPGYSASTNGSQICQIDCSYFLQGCNTTACNSEINCTACISSNTYYLSYNATSDTSQCLLCNSSIYYCLTCISSNVCTFCEPGYYLYLAGCLSCSNISYCTNCSYSTGLITCHNCEAGYLRFFDGVSYSCDCNQTLYLHNCAVCTDVLICDSCAQNYLIKTVGNLSDCYACSTFIPYCLNCTIQTTCLVCDNPYYLYHNSTSLQTVCRTCQIVNPNCQSCNNNGSCGVCDTFYGVNSLLACSLCNQTMVGCYLCVQASICQQCIDGYVLLNNSCSSCNREIPGCIQCTSTISGVFCYNCSEGYFLNAGDCVLCSAQMLNCEVCSNDSYCQVCSGSFIHDINFTCNNCSVGTYVTGTCSFSTGCLNARLINGVQTCIGCDVGLHFQFNSTTKKCVCQLGYVMYNNEQCLYLCRNNLVQTMQCDDGNSIDGDGCSKLCKLQPGSNCTTSATGLTNCVLTQDFSITLNYVKRVLGQNAALLSFTIKPASTKLQSVDWKSIVIFNFSSAVNVTYDYSNGQLLVKVAYGSSINGQDISLKLNFDSNQIISKPSQLNFKLIGINGPLTYEANLSDYESFITLSWIIVGITLIQFLVSTYFHKMIGLQTIQCIQTIYFIRIIVKNATNSSIYGLNCLKYSNGYNDITNSKTSLTSLVSAPPTFVKLDLGLQFLQNVNIMLIPIAIAGLVYLIYKIQMLYNKYHFLSTSSKQFKDRYTILKRTAEWFYEHYLFTFSMALLFIVIFSTVLKTTSNTSSISQSDKLQQGVNFCANQIFILFIFIIMSFQIVQGVQSFQKNGNSQSIGQNILDYDENKSDSFSQIYVPIYLLYYICLIFLMVTSIDNFQYVAEVAFAHIAFYSILICIWRPYLLLIHNVAIIINQLCVLIFVLMILFIKYAKLSQSSYSVMYYFVIICLFGINFIAAIRIFTQWRLLSSQTKLKRNNPNRKSSGSGIYDLFKQNKYIYNEKNRQQYQNQYKVQFQNIQKRKQNSNILELNVQNIQKLIQTNLHQPNKQSQQYDSLKVVKQRLRRQFSDFVEDE